MRSSESTRDEDRTTKARIRDAAITRFADDGVAATSIRAIAAAAGVSPALVIHHFGSKDALRVACDEHIAEVLREQKAKSLRAGPGMDVVSALRDVRGGPPLSRYLARSLIDGTPHVAEIIDEMVADGVKYMAEGVESGVLQPTAFPYERTAVLTIWSLGALVLHEHLERLIGVDVLNYPPEDPADAWPYVGPLIEMMTEGVVTAEAAEQMRAALGPNEAAATNEEDDGS